MKGRNQATDYAADAAVQKQHQRGRKAYHHAAKRPPTGVKSSILVSFMLENRQRDADQNRSAQRTKGLERYAPTPEPTISFGRVLPPGIAR